MSLKKKIKNLMPDRVVYCYSVLRLFPKYMRARGCMTAIPEMKFHTNQETVDLIIKERKSFSRFGDGEFIWMSGESVPSFQDYSPEFAQDLREAFKSKDKNLLIGVPYGVFDASKCNVYARMHWRIIRTNFLPRLIKFVDKDRVYCDASITRPYIDYRNRKFSESIFSMLKCIWDDKDIVIVEGDKTKLGMGNDLLYNARSVKRIICPAENAYSVIGEIEKFDQKNVSKDTLILGALGPTASILAAQLCGEGYQFVDIGHIDVEYMWYQRHAILRETIEGKYVNESGIRTCSAYYDEEEDYKNSIIDRIT